MDILISLGGLSIANKSKKKISLSLLCFFEIQHLGLSADLVSMCFCIELSVECESTNL